MLLLRENPKGLDVLIQKLQTKLYSYFKSESIKGYGRVYLNEKNGREVPQYYAENGEYKDVLFDDRLTGSFFFLEDGLTKKSSSRLTTPVSLIILLNLDDLTPDFKGRNDEEVKTDIYAIIEQCKYFDLTQIIKGKDVLKQFKVSKNGMHPHCYLRFNGTMKYQGIY